MSNFLGRLWLPGIVGVALVLSIPILTIGGFIFEPSGDNWQHLKQTVLPEYLTNSALLVIGVSIGTLLIGVSTAWLTAMCRFPGKRWFVWLLLLPLAMPAYIIAYTYTGMFDFAGPVQTQLREWTGWGYGDYYFPEVRSLGGAIAMLSLVLYPYVYMLARVSFLGQGRSAYEAGRSLGLGPWAAFFRVSLPMARPGIIAGLSLALMEALADFGAVAVFNYDTFTTAIYKAWFGFFDLHSAAQLASILLTIVLVALVIERRFRERARFTSSGSVGPQRRMRLLGGRRRVVQDLRLLGQLGRDDEVIQDMLNRRPRDEAVDAEEYLARLTAERRQRRHN